MRVSEGGVGVSFGLASTDSLCMQRVDPVPAPTQLV